MRRSYNDYVERKRREYGDKFDTSALNPDFIPYFENGARIEVTCGPCVRRGTVGVTTGWKPCFLLMPRCDSTSSSDTIGPNDKITKIIRR